MIESVTTVTLDRSSKRLAKSHTQRSQRTIGTDTHLEVGRNPTGASAALGL